MRQGRPVFSATSPISGCSETSSLEPNPPPVVVEPEPVKQKRVPAVCAISIDGAERSVTLYPESCMRAEGFKPRLPRGCANTAPIFE